MADAPRRGRGRPKKYADPGAARQAKLKYDRERKQRLLKKPPDEDERLISSLPRYTGPTTTQRPSLAGDLPLTVRLPTPIAIEEECILSEDTFPNPVFDTGNLDANPTADDTDLNTPNHVQRTNQFVLTVKEPDLNMEDIFLNARKVSLKAPGVVFNAQHFTMRAQNLVMKAPGFNLSSQHLVLKANKLNLTARGFDLNARAIRLKTQNFQMQAKGSITYSKG